MMLNQTYSVYNLSTGRFAQRISCPAASLDMNVPEGHGCVLGEYDLETQMIDIETSEVIDYQPPPPSVNHVWNAETRRWVYVPTLADHKTARLADINKRCEQELAVVRANYPDGEVQSWAKQESEARAYAADNAAAIPLIEALSAARGVPVAELVNRIIAKADSFAVISGQIIGNRQRCEDEINAATTIEEVEAVTWDV
jgi:hypothetical protein